MYGNFSCDNDTFSWRSNICENSQHFCSAYCVLATVLSIL